LTFVAVIRYNLFLFCPPEFVEVQAKQKKYFHFHLPAGRSASPSPVNFFQHKRTELYLTFVAAIRYNLFLFCPPEFVEVQAKQKKYFHFYLPVGRSASPSPVNFFQHKRFINPVCICFGSHLITTLNQ